MKKTLLAGAIVMMLPFAAFAQTTTTATTTATTSPAVTIAEPGYTPSDFFYFLDRWSESLSDFFTFNKERKARLQLEHAKERVAEMNAVLKKADAKLEDVSPLKSDFDKEVAAAAALVSNEKAQGVDVSTLASDLSEELERSREALKNIYQEYQDNQGRAEEVIRAKLSIATSTDAANVQGLTQALESITKEKEDAKHQEESIDTEFDDEQSELEDAMDPAEAAQKRAEHAREALKKEAERQAEASSTRHESDDSNNDENGVDVGQQHLDDLERELNKTSDALEGFEVNTNGTENHNNR